jgi:hypothetical protein
MTKSNEKLAKMNELTLFFNYLIGLASVLSRIGESDVFVSV